MTIRKKIRISLGITMLILLLLLDLIFTGVLRTASYQASKERMIRDLSRATGLINAEAQTLSAISATWAHSDATWHYLRGNNPDFILPLFDRNNLKEIGISSIILLNNKQKVALQKNYSPFDEPSSPESELATILSYPENEKMIKETNDTGVSGIVLRGSEPILFSLKPVLTSDMRGPVAGHLIATRPFNPEFIKTISDNLNFNFSIEATSEEDRGNPFLEEILIDDIKRKNTMVSGKMLVKDHTGKPSFWIHGMSPRKDTTEVERKMQLLFLAIAACVLILCCGFDFVLKRILYDRIKKLEEEAEAIQEDAQSSDGITVDKMKDEITDLQQAITDVINYKEYCCKKNVETDAIRLMVHERFATHSSHLCLKTLEELATALTPGDDGVKYGLLQKAQITKLFCKKLGIADNELVFSYLGALFSKIGIIGLPHKLRSNSTELTEEELREYRNYPLISRDIMRTVELLRSSSSIACNWNENWDGTGFPNGKKEEQIPIEARAFAVVNEWNELSRLKPGRKAFTFEEMEAELRLMKGTRLDPDLVEEFIIMLKKHNIEK